MSAARPRIHLRRPAALRAAAAALALLLAGCAAAPGGTPTPAPAVPAAAPAPAAPAATVPRFPVPTTPAWISARIAELEALREKAPDPEGALALELALLHSHPANPATDHVKALALMRTYLALAPAGSPDQLVLHVAGLLEDIEQLGRITREARGREKELAAKLAALEQRAAEPRAESAAAKKREQELQAQVASLQAQVATLQQQIATLQQRIEQLQQLDLEMEKRRRSVK